MNSFGLIGILCGTVYILMVISDVTVFKMTR